MINNKSILNKNLYNFKKVKYTLNITVVFKKIGMLFITEQSFNFKQKISYFYLKKLIKEKKKDISFYKKKMYNFIVQNKMIIDYTRPFHF